jgi:uroporphyrinogen-III decarboxylase
MTSRDRLLTAIRNDTPDRVPVGPFDLGHLSRDSAIARELIRVTDPFIQCGVGGDPIWGADVPRESIRDGNDTITIVHTPKGDIRSVWRRTDIASATVEYYCRTAEDAEKWLSLPYTPPVPDLADFHRVRQEIGEEGLVLAGMGDAVCLPAALYSPEDFCLLWADAPDVMRKLVRIAAERINAHIERVCTLGLDAFRIVGGEYASVQLGPQAFQELVVEPDKELCDIMRRHGAVSYFHNHGPVTRFYDQFLEMGIDALDPMEAPPWGDCILSEAKARFGGRICMVGNLDDMEVLESLSWEEIEPIAAERLAQAGPDGFVLGGTASGTYGERAARNFMKLVPLAEAMASRWV